MSSRKMKIIALWTLYFFIAFTLTGNGNFQKEEDILVKARMLIQDGDFEGAINELTEVVEKLKTIITKKRRLAEAYFLLAKVFYVLQMNDKFESNMRMVFKTYPSFDVPESDPEMEGIINKVKSETKNEKIIQKEVKKKKKKKIPVIAIVAGIALITVVFLLLKKKKETAPDSNYDTNVLGLEWVNIPGGHFQMGDNFGEGWTDEIPVHSVNLDSYRISKFEITFNQYDTFCEETHRNKPDDLGWGRDNRPAINVSWNDAKAFCDWLSQKTGKTIHLPTEAQWEKAARGTDQRRYPWGNFSPSCDITNFNMCVGRTMPIGSYSSDLSQYGVQDMGGNVYEWCADWYDPAYYSTSPATNPQGPTSGSQRVHRGGRWNSDIDKTRSANRDSTSPSHSSSRSGFRICWNQ